MINSEKPNVPEFIREALVHAMNKEFDKLKDEFLKELGLKRSQIVAGLMIHVMEQSSMRDMGHYLEIRLFKPTNQDQK